MHGALGAWLVYSAYVIHQRAEKTDKFAKAPTTCNMRTDHNERTANVRNPKATKKIHHSIAHRTKHLTYGCEWSTAEPPVRAKGLKPAWMLRTCLGVWVGHTPLVPSVPG